MTRTANFVAALLSMALVFSCQTMPTGSQLAAQYERPTSAPPVDEMPAPEGQPVVATDAVEEVQPVDPLAEQIQTTKAVPVAPVWCEEPPMPMVNISPWTPPGFASPWPHDEYLEDGGDREVQANLGAEGELRGLELEDTVAIYDTIDGQTRIKPSNRVCLYAPRFAAVRKVTSVIENLQNDQLTAVSQPVLPQMNQEDQLATTAVQPVQPRGEKSTRQLSLEQTNEVVLPSITLQPILGIEGGLATYENLLLMREGKFEESEKARIAELVDAAIAWTDNQAVQVVLDGRAAVDVTGDQRVQATFRVDVPNSPCLRVIKIASKKVAKPGEIVEFTIRFDNTGDQTIKKVELVDNLTTRLEYVPQTAQSSRQADFSTEPNDGGSLLLRWEFVDPLPAGDGGLVHFKCRVR